LNGESERIVFKLAYLTKNGQYQNLVYRIFKGRQSRMPQQKYMHTLVSKNAVCNPFFLPLHKNSPYHVWRQPGAGSKPRLNREIRRSEFVTVPSFRSQPVAVTERPANAVCIRVVLLSHDNH